MKEKKYALFLGVEAVALILLTRVLNFKAESIFDLLSYPLQKLSDFLGFLSLKSSFGNAVAIGVYVLICLVPIFALLFKAKRKTFQKADSLLVLMSAVLFVVIYLLINPTEMGMLGYIESSAVMVAFSFWSLFVGYLILKFTSSLQKADSSKTEKLLSALLKIIGAVFVFSLCTVKSAATGIGIMNFLAFVNLAVPNVFGVVAVFGSLNLLSEIITDKYSEFAVKATENLSQLCILGVKVSVLVSALYNVLQLRFINELSNVNFKVEIPLLSLGFILTVLVMSKYIRDSKALKEDNDSFI